MLNYVPQGVAAQAAVAAVAAQEVAARAVPREGAIK